MTSKEELDRKQERISKALADLYAELGEDLVSNPDLGNLLVDRAIALVDQANESGSSDGPPPPDGGLASLIGLGDDAAPDLGKVDVPARVKNYDEIVTSDRINALGRLYYIYQHESVGVFRAVLKLQELFEAGAVKLSTGPGAYALYRFDRRGVLRYSANDRLKAYKRVFGYTNAPPPAGATPNLAFHGLFAGFMGQLSQFFRDKRISEVVRKNADDPSFGSIASVRRRGLDLRDNLKGASYGHASVLSVEAAQLLQEAFVILGAEDIRQLFGADDAWDVVGETMRRYFGVANLPVSQRSRMARSGQDVLQYLAGNDITNRSRPQIEASLGRIADAAEEWLTSAEELGDIPKRATRVSPGPRSRETELFDLMI